MNYRHLFHAGNFADVCKHAILTQLLRALRRKDKAFAYIETHAGAGRYDLRAPEAQKTGEYRDGIARLWASPETELGIVEYLSAVRALNPGAALRYYPGSPRLARYFLRTQDRMRLAELAPDEHSRLQAEFRGDGQVTVQRADGYAALAQWLPPPQRRGLVFIDPPYEAAGEWERLPATLVAAVQRWRQGTYALWYPLKADAPVERFKAEIVRSGLRKVLTAEVSLWPPDSPFRLNGCGMLVVNPPWQVDAQLPDALAPLVQRLRQNPGAEWRIDRLVPE